MEFRVDLDNFHGPMDLLLYLIRRDELDIHDIRVSTITDEYVQYLTRLQAIDVNLAGDFLVMAATLMEIKSIELLPHQEAVVAEHAAEAEDPRAELIQQLLEYKRAKDQASLLESRRETHEARFPRKPAKLEGTADEPPPLDMEEVQVWDLLDAFARLMTELGQRGPRQHEVTVDDTPIELHAADIEDRLKRDGKLTLRDLLVGRRNRAEMIGIFLALLELVREKKVRAVQETPEAEIDLAPIGEKERAAMLEGACS